MFLERGRSPKEGERPPRKFNCGLGNLCGCVSWRGGGSSLRRGGCPLGEVPGKSERQQRSMQRRVRWCLRDHEKKAHFLPDVAVFAQMNGEDLKEKSAQKARRFLHAFYRIVPLLSYGYSREDERTLLPRCTLYPASTLVHAIWTHQAVVSKSGSSLSALDR